MGNGFYGTTYSGVLSDNGAGGSLNIVGGALTLTGSNTYTGTTTISAGTLQIGNGGTRGAVSGPITDNAVLVFDRGDSSLVVTNTIGGNGSLTQMGSGTLILGEANSYSGNTFVSGGTLVLGNSLAIQDSTFITGGTAGFSFGGLAAATFGGLTGSGNLSLTNTSGAAVALSVGANNNSTTYSGILSDNATGAGLNKLGTGTLTLTGSNTYTGPTTIAAGGGLQVGAGGSGASIGGTPGVTDNGSLIFNHSDAVTFSQAISGNGSVVQTGSGLLVLTNSNSYVGTTISGGTLQVGIGGTTGSLGSGPVADNAALLFDRSGNSAVIAGTLSGSGSLIQVGTGTLTLMRPTSSRAISSSPRGRSP